MAAQFSLYAEIMPTLPSNFTRQAQNQIQRAMRGVSPELDTGRASQQASSVGRKMGGLFKSTFLLGAAGIAGGIASIFGGLKYGLDIASQNEQASITFTHLLKDAEKAGTFIKDLQKFAAKTPFEFKGLQESSVQLLTAGFNAKDVIPIMTNLGNVASTMGEKGPEAINRMTFALRQISNAGRITAEDLNQLQDAGLPVFGILAKSMGKTKEEIVALAKTGGLGKEAVDALFKALKTGKGLEKFAGLMDKQSKSLNGIISTLKDNLGQGLANAIAPYMPQIKKAIESVSEALPGIIKGFFRLIGVAASFWKTHGPAISNAFKTVGTVVRDAASWFATRLAPALRQVGDHFKKNIVPALQGLKKTWDENKSSIMTWWNSSLKPAIAWVIKYIVPLFGKILVSAVKQFITAVRFVITAFNWVIETGSTMRIHMLGVFRTVASAVLTATGVMLQGFTNAFSWIPGLGPKLKTANDKFQTFARNAITGIDGTIVKWKEFDTKLKDNKARNIAEGKLKDINKQITSLKGQKIVDISVKGDTPAKEKLRQLLIQQRALSLGISPSQAQKEVQKDLDRNNNKSYATGGWTGAGSKYEPAGIVHADEFVVKKESRQKVEKQNPGFLDYINRTGKLPGFASGGQVWPFKVDASKTKTSFPDLLRGAGGAMGGVLGALGSIPAWVRAAKAMSVFGRNSGIGNWLFQQVKAAGLANSNQGIFNVRRTATGNKSMHGYGRAVDLPPSMKTFNWLRSNFGSQLKELIFSPAGGSQIYNGRPHVYSGITKAMHYNHIHASYANGGRVGAGIYDQGGILGHGQMGLNLSGKPERVLSPRETKDYGNMGTKLDLIAGLLANKVGGDVHFNGDFQSDVDVALAMQRATYLTRGAGG